MLLKKNKDKNKIYIKIHFILIIFILFSLIRELKKIMSDFIIFRKNNLLLWIIFILIILMFLIIKYKDQICFECILQPTEMNEEKFIPSPPQNNGMMIADLPMSQKNIIDRVYPQNEYPYKAPGFYDQSNYPNLVLPFQVIGGGRRMTPTLGGTQIPILNPPVPIIVNNENIAPINIETRPSDRNSKRIGVIYKIFGNANDILPLFVRRYGNRRLDYTTLIGPFASPLPVITKNQYDELSTNDTVFIKGQKDPYRVTIYSDDLPAYIPYV